MRRVLSTAVLASTLLVSSSVFARVQAPWAEGLCYVQPFSGKALYRPSSEVVYEYGKWDKGYSESMRLYLRQGEEAIGISCSKDRTIVATNLRIMLMAGGEDVFYNSVKTTESYSFNFDREAKSAIIGRDGTVFVLDILGNLTSYKLSSGNMVEIDQKAALGKGASIEARGSRLYGVDSTGKKSYVCDLP